MALIPFIILILFLIIGVPESTPWDSEEYKCAKNPSQCSNIQEDIHKEDVLHREDGPTQEWASGPKFWYI